MALTQLQLREDPRSTPGFYGPWSFKVLESWSLIRSKMANFWQLWQSKSSFPSISNDILDLQYLIRYYLPIHKMHCMWMYYKSKVKVFWARLCNLLEKDWQHSRLDTWLDNHPFCICKFMSFKTLSEPGLRHSVKERQKIKRMKFLSLQCLFIFFFA